MTRKLIFYTRYATVVGVQEDNMKVKLGLGLKLFLLV